MDKTFGVWSFGCRAEITMINALSFFALLLCRRGVDWDCDVSADVDNGWGECIVQIESGINAWNIRFDLRLILSYFLNHFIFYFDERD